MKNTLTPEEVEFIAYFKSFYAPYQIYGDFFNHKLNTSEIEQGLKLLKSWANKTNHEIHYDTHDRELMRDIVLAFSYKTAPLKLEHWVPIYNLRNTTITEDIVIKQWNAYYKTHGIKVSKALREEWANRAQQVAQQLNP
jgi:hypothetical protein